MSGHADEEVGRPTGSEPATRHGGTCGPAGPGALDPGPSARRILSARANGLTLLLLAAWFCYEAVHRLLSPSAVAGAAVLTAVVGIVVNVAATWLISRTLETGPDAHAVQPNGPPSSPTQDLRLGGAARH